ncbi:hypothetical protein KsCSTR_37120 [Candidatus Kuenenia stuttgartiensis]|uniref:Uncharacterized protein n=1 Tax=Kuenenia stuttgartiensis TaxID=174633 RepID=Q1Q6A8_KUEST|nr:hypothetical protein KsCSTR_37120 [Candidatus Kuenenia stuttgartiensis]CAJ73109.1 unknown protein [Candidatus Kuenenia stuttgartiensis]
MSKKKGSCPLYHHNYKKKKTPINFYNYQGLLRLNYNNIFNSTLYFQYTTLIVFYIRQNIRVCLINIFII